MLTELPKPKVLYVCLIAALVSATGCQMPTHPARTPSEIRGALRQCIEKQLRAPGIVAGVIDEHGTNVYSLGQRERGKPAEVNGDTLFEIGSITKVFTTILLQDMIDRGEVRLDDPIGKYLPATVKTLVKGGRQITLLDLATHTSGLPSIPGNMSPSDGDNPYADYTVEQMYQFLSTNKLAHTPGKKFEYSNLGMGLLGHILALRMKTNYEALVVERICDPLHMDSTRINLTPELRARLATGHSPVGPPVKYWTGVALEGDGALYSSVNDMLKFLAANMGRGPSNLCATMAKTHAPLRRMAWGFKIGLGWINFAAFGAHFTWHNGMTGGFASYIGFDSDKRRGAVALANAASEIDDLGQCLFYPVFDVNDTKPPIQRKALQVDPAIYDRYIGQYRISSKKTVTIERDGNRLLARENWEMNCPYEIFPESKTSFFFTADIAVVRFIVDKGDNVTGLTLYQDGKKQPAVRIAKR